MSEKYALGKEADLTYKVFLHLVMKVEIGALNAGLVDNLMVLSQAAALKILDIQKRSKVSV